MAARNIALLEGAVFRSDRVGNYTSADFAREPAALGIRQSVGRTGICYDNALAESVNGTLKVKLVHRTVCRPGRKHGKTLRGGSSSTTIRLVIHPGLGYRTPQKVIDEFLKEQEAA